MDDFMTRPRRHGFSGVAFFVAAVITTSNVQCDIAVPESLTLSVSPRSSLGYSCKNVPKEAKTIRMVCRVWPYVGFPTISYADAKQLEAAIVRPGGLKDRATDLKTARSASDDFCWRHSEPRKSKQPSGRSCPSKFNSAWFERETVEVPVDNGKGDFICEKKCDDVCGDETQYRGQSANGKRCSCEHPSSGTIVVVDRVVPSLLDGCGVVIGGKCFAECPRNFMPPDILGEIFPVCKFRCEADPNRSFPCGYGCANSEATCELRMVHQVEHVNCAPRDASKVFMGGNFNIGICFGAIISIVEFASAVVEPLLNEDLSRSFHGDVHKVVVMGALFHAMLGADQLEEAFVKYALRDFASFLDEAIDVLKQDRLTRNDKMRRLRESLKNLSYVSILSIYHLIMQHALSWPRCGHPRTEAVGKRHHLPSVWV
eukprot:TRINITY_DN23245_c0_g1_i1.p1 TRINITY_DN23245_c0_g1~~TRINITY_DN23245_c0_g1_i1.p1  ORF type:complete len:428 (-),score=25.68 TRINITY_DN23245_c0_g1_i1:99-1382(-)